MKRQIIKLVGLVTAAGLLGACYVQGSGGAYVEPAPATVTVDYEPLTYNGYVVHYDTVGRPMYFYNNAWVYVPTTYVYYNNYVTHYRTHRWQYRRWYQRRGSRIYHSRALPRYRRGYSPHRSTYRSRPGYRPGPTYRPGTTHRSTYRPGTVHRPTYRPGTVHRPTYRPGTVHRPTYRPGTTTYRSGATYRPGTSRPGTVHRPATRPAVNRTTRTTTRTTTRSTTTNRGTTTRTRRHR